MAKADLLVRGTYENTPLQDPEQPAVVVKNVSMVFNIANERLNSLKEYILKLVTRQLFYREFVALDDISLVVERGDIFGIVGVNGSGKSTLLKIIAGVLEPTRGEVRTNGRIAPLIELGAGFDFELTARENIYLNAALLGYSKNYVNEHFEEIVEFAELQDFMELPLKNYSSGMVARIAFAIATAVVPDLLIVDETLSVGDMFFQEKCMNRINELIDKYGTTVLFVSHSIGQVEELCRKAVWIEKGRIRRIGTAAEVCDEYKNSQ
ncbi:MAG: ABC transporter ATP-binding protein [Actinomycetia bacterium]|nr:ABC transporter ATP-binding protein [Actinomycetes bacterium]